LSSPNTRVWFSSLRHLLVIQAYNISIFVLGHFLLFLMFCSPSLTSFSINLWISHSHNFYKVFFSALFIFIFNPLTYQSHAVITSTRYWRRRGELQGVDNIGGGLELELHGQFSRSFHLSCLLAYLFFLLAFIAFLI
jgi:hypothetical protein